MEFKRSTMIAGETGDPPAKRCPGGGAESCSPQPPQDGRMNRDSFTGPQPVPSSRWIASPNSSVPCTAAGCLPEPSHHPSAVACPKANASRSCGVARTLTRWPASDVSVTCTSSAKSSTDGWNAPSCWRRIGRRSVGFTSCLLSVNVKEIELDAHQFVRRTSFCVGLQGLCIEFQKPGPPPHAP